MHVFVKSCNGYKGLQGNTTDNPAVLARKFSNKHKMPLSDQIKLKKLVQEKIASIDKYKL